MTIPRRLAYYGKLFAWPCLLVAQPSQGIPHTTESHAARIAVIEQRLLPATPLATDRDTDWSVRERMRVHGVPGLSVAMVHNGRVAWQRAYGMRDAVTRAAVTPNTMFQAGSISKPLAALVALQMVERGRLALDDDVNRRLRQWQVPTNRFTRQRPVTLRGVLTHTAGVTVRGFDGYRPGMATPTLRQILDGRPPANSPPIRVDTVPGTVNRYSGGGFLIAQALMEDVAGQSFDRIADSALFAPLQLERTTYRPVTEASNAGDVASGHDRAGHRIDGRWRVLPEMAAASLWSTPTELATVLVAMQRAAQRDAAGPLSPGTVLPMMQLQGPAQGLGIGLKGETPYRFSHAGSNDGFQAQFIGYLDRGEGIVVMTNGDGGDALAMEYIRAVARAYGWNDLAPVERTPVALSAGARRALTGRYRLGPSWTIDVRARGDTLVAGPTGRALLPLLAEDSSHYFFTAVDGVSIDVASWQDGVVEAITWSANGRRTTGSRERGQLLSDVVIIDGTGAEARRGQDVVIRDGRITEIAPHGRATDTAFVEFVPLSGRTLMPGLIDAHVHLATYPREPALQDALLRAALLGGVTTVRDMGGNVAELRAMASRSAPDTVPRARLFYSAVMSGPSSMWFTDARRDFFAGGSPVGLSPGVRQVERTSNVRAIIRDAKNTGATGIKLYAKLSPSLLRDLTTEAHRAGLKVWAHLSIGPGRPSDVVRAGVDVVSHADMFIREIVPVPAVPDERDRARTADAFATVRATSAPMQQLLRVMQRRGTALDPTLSIMYSAARDTTNGDSPDVLAARQRRYTTLATFATAMTREARRLGIPILAGTDALGRGTPALHWELQLLVEAVGMTPTEAIHAATLANARALGAADSLGSIAVGKRADLVVLNADPTVDIANTQSIEAVLRAGVWHRRQQPMAPLPYARAPQSTTAPTARPTRP